MKGKTGTVILFLTMMSTLASSLMVQAKVLEPLLKKKCTVLLLDMSSQFIQSLQSAYNHYTDKSTFLTQDTQSMTLSSLSTTNQELAPLRTCYIGISYTHKIDFLQEILLKTHNRVMFAIANSVNHSTSDFDVSLNNKHHPIAVLETKNKVTLLHVKCHKNMSIFTNAFVNKNWIKIFGTTGMTFERICNHGRHPLYGKSLSVQCNSIFPHDIATSSGELTGGMIFHILDALSWKFGFSYNITYDGSTYTLSNGSVGGAYGKVLTGESDFATWFPSGSPSFGGERSHWLHAEAYILAERTPRKLPQTLSLLKTFDLHTWLFLVATFLAVSAAACTTSILGNSELGHTEFHLKCPKVRFGGISANWLRILWVVVYYFLIISFQSLLRASLITPNYETLYGSLEALVEKGAKFHMGQSLYDQLDLFRDLSPTTKHIVEQAEKYKTAYPIESANQESVSYVDREFYRQGGAIFGTATSALVVAAKNIRSGKGVSGVEIRDARTWVYISFFFQKFDPRAAMFQVVSHRMFDGGLTFGVFSMFDPFSGVKLFTSPEDVKLVFNNFLLVFAFGGTCGIISVMTFIFEMANRRNQVEK